MVVERLRQLHTQLADENANPVVVWEVLDFLRRNPRLVYQEYDVGGGSFTTLHLFFKMGVGLDSIQKLLQICPNETKLFNMKDHDGGSPIHMACQYSSYPVVEYLIQKPSLSSHFKRAKEDGMTPRGLLPVHCALLNTAQPFPNSTIKALLQFCRKSGSEGSKHWSDALCLALMTNQPSDILFMIADEFPAKEINLIETDVDDFDALMVGRDVKPLSLEQTKPLARLFERVEKVEFYYSQGWDADAFTYLMNQLATNQHTTHLDHLTLPNLEESCLNEAERLDVLASMELFLSRNTAITNFGINLNEKDAAIWQRWCGALETGLAGNTAMSSVRFNCLYTEHVDGWNLMKRSVLFWETPEVTSANANISPGRKRRLLMDGFELSDKHFAERLRCAPDCLDTLELEDCSPMWETVLGAQPTSVVAEFVGGAKGRSLTTLKIRDCHFDALPIFEAIKLHPNMRAFEADYQSLLDAFEEEYDELSEAIEREELVSVCLDMIQNHNTTLVQCSPWDSLDSRIKYHLELNRFGLANVRKNTDRVDKLVDTLLPLQDSTQWIVHMENTLFNTPNGETYSSFIRQKKGDALQTSLLYGLLRENPGLLCRCTGRREEQKKRKERGKQWKQDPRMEKKLAVSPTTAGAGDAAGDAAVTCGCWGHRITIH
ncbi:expressed unknown protein [Seminavis robusta]|uniref:Uncharacterized protein n=1 Tax=Seminavis robusta TaxID=568900 RepID=A0A9N8EL24_9STRA|nr:expressed unknown protein [Seminavis robusta]|eukprot:Sro1389_g268560.1 n/a (660) ;mRNA; f:15867-17846